MGEVYRATDSNLKRSVAIKVLPASVAGDADRLARFQREAEVLAALNHPNIAAIYGLERTPELTALVMELVEGEDLSLHISRGPIPLSDALVIGKQIADALEAAHEQGIIHRDLKPANIKVRADGTVKVLDFGLAKALDTDPSGTSAGAMNSPTLTARATQMGMLLGTAAYMAPEQARGRAVDRRADIWAFGVVLYEMLTGRRAFEGDDISITLASVLKEDVNWQALPGDLPQPLRRLLRRCLEKDPKRRLSSIGDARFELEEASAPVGENTDRLPAPAPASGAVAPPYRRADGRLGWTVAAVLALGLGALGWWSAFGRTTVPPQLLRMTIPSEVPGGGSYRDNVNGSVAISPDGATLVFRAGVTEGNTLLYQRRMDQYTATPITGTEIPYAPFFSPDGESLAFASFGSLKKVALAGGAPFTICPLPATLRGASWGEDDFIYFSVSGGPILRVSSAGGTPEPVTKLGPDERSHRWAQVLPGAKAILYTVWSDTGFDTATIYAESLVTHERQIVARGGSDGRYVKSGHVVYTRPEGLLAVPFDPATLKTTGAARPVVSNVVWNSASGHGQFAVSTNGILAFVPGAGVSSETSLVWVDRKGASTPARPEKGRYTAARLSPDGTRAALGIADPNGTEQIWILDPAHGTLVKRTFEGSSILPVWSHDGAYITYGSTRSDGTANIYRRPADGSGTEERLTNDKTRTQWPNVWSGDGKVLTIEEVGGGLSYLTMDGKPERHPLLESAWNKDTPRISWDGKWLAYASAESGPLEIVVQPFPSLAGKYLISAGGGTAPRWSRDGRQLFYWEPPGRIMAVDVATTPSFTWSKPAMLFEGPYASEFDVTADGSRFLMIKEPDQGRTANHINVVVNWFQELQKK